MEPPWKRARVGISPYDDDVDADELFSEPQEVDARRDPGYQLQRSRDFAAFKLKSTFEHIFEKYEKDFTGIGDEIDLRTGEVVVDNGHLVGMQNERDLGGAAGTKKLDARPDATDTESTDEDDKILHGDTLTQHVAATNTIVRRPGLQAPARRSDMWPGSRMSRMSMSYQPKFMGSPSSYGTSGGPFRDPVEPAWRAPDIIRTQPLQPKVMQMFGSHRYTIQPDDGESIWAPKSRFATGLLDSSSTSMRPKGQPLKKAPRRLLPPNETDEDDILLGVSASRRKYLPSPPTSQAATDCAMRDANDEHQAGNTPAASLTSAEEGGALQTQASQQENGPISLETSIFPANSQPSHGALQENVPNQTAVVEDVENVLKRKRGRPKGSFRKILKPIVTQESEAPNASLTSDTPEKITGRVQARAAAAEKQVVVAKVRKNAASSKQADEPDRRRSGREKKQTEFYNKISWIEARALRKPSNQLFTVEITQKETPQITHVSEPEELSERASSPLRFVEEVVLGETDAAPGENLVVSKEQDVPVSQPRPETPESDARVIPDSQNGSPNLQSSPTKNGGLSSSNRMPIETFFRNMLDPSYAFSDEEEGSLPTKEVRSTKPIEARARHHSSPSPTLDSVPIGIGEGVEDAGGLEGAEDEGLPEVEVTSTAEESTTAKPQSGNPASSEEPGDAQPLENADSMARASNKRDGSEPSAKRKRKQSVSRADNTPPEAAQDAAEPLPVAHPSTPQGKKLAAKPRSSANPPSRASIATLISDDEGEEDELSLVLTPSGRHASSFTHDRAASSLRTLGERRPRLLGPRTPVKPHSASKVRVSSRSGRRMLGSAGRTGYASLTRIRGSLPLRLKKRAKSPTESLVRTPGGTMRKCGEHGFKCDRDFCFTCM